METTSGVVGKAAGGGYGGGRPACCRLRRRIWSSFRVRGGMGVVIDNDDDILLLGLCLAQAPDAASERRWTPLSLLSYNPGCLLWLGRDFLCVCVVVLILPPVFLVVSFPLLFEPDQRRSLRVVRVFVTFFVRVQGFILRGSMVWKFVVLGVSRSSFRCSTFPLVE